MMHALVKKITKPISSKHKVGKFPEESALRDYLDAEIMKAGTLQHENIGWQKVEQRAVTYLSTECKDFKVLSYLLMCLQNDGNPERFLTSLQLLCAFMKTYWETGFPKPGKSGIALKKKVIRLVLDRSLESAKNIKVFESDTVLVPDFKDVEKDLKATLRTCGIRYAGVDKIPQGVIKKLEDLEKNAAKKIASHAPKAKVSAEELGEFNLLNDRGIKQAYLKLARFTNETDIKNPLGFQLRRFAIWHGISAAPPQNKKGYTEMVAVPADRIAEYTEGIAQAASMELLARIEHTVSTSPFWLQGSFLAATCATTLKFPAVAHAILTTAAGFIERVPDLKESCFTDGSPFVDDTTSEWLGTLSEKRSQTVAQNNFQEIYKEQGLEAALHHVNAALKKSKEKREVFHLRFLTAQLLHQSGFVDLAKQQAAALAGEIEQMNVQDWESSFIKKIEKLAR